MVCVQRIIVSGVEGRDRTRGGEGEEQGKAMPPSDSGSQLSEEPESSVIVGSGATMAAWGVSSQMKKRESRIKQARMSAIIGVLVIKE